MELVSVVVPAYNAEKTIERAVKSLQQQTYKNIEIIIINDGSKDKTDDICRRLAEKDSRIQYRLIENGGVSNARNEGISYCNGRYIAFLDSDDQMESTMIEKIVSFIDDTIDLVCCGYKVITANDEVIFEQSPIQMKKTKSEAYMAVENLQLNTCMNSLWNKLFRSSVIKENQIKMDTTISMGEDLLFILNYLRLMNGDIVVIPDTEYRYTLSPNGLQVNFDNNSELRIDQLNEIKQLYISQDYPLDGFYLEELRTIYVMILENSKTVQDVRMTLSLPICEEVRRNKFRCNGKYKVFHILLKLNRAHVMNVFIRMFVLLKKLQGKTYSWKG